MKLYTVAILGATGAVGREMLKILEEPPKYGIFLLLTDNPEKILPTVRSRCTELKLQSLPADILKKQLLRDFPDAQEQDLEAAAARSGGFLGQALQLMEEGNALPAQTTDFLSAYAARDSYGLLQVLVPMEKLSRDQLIPLPFFHRHQSLCQKQRIFSGIGL